MQADMQADEQADAQADVQGSISFLVAPFLTRNQEPTCHFHFLNIFPMKFMTWVKNVIPRLE